MSFSKRNTTKKIYTRKPRLNSTRKRKRKRKNNFLISHKRRSHRRRSNRRRSNRRRSHNAKMLIGPGQVGGRISMFKKKEPPPEEEVLGGYNQITLKYFKFDESEGAGGDVERPIMYLSKNQKEDDKTVMTPINNTSGAAEDMDKEAESAADAAETKMEYPETKDLFDGNFNVSLIKSGNTIKFKKNGEFHLNNKWRGACGMIKRPKKRGRCCTQTLCLKNAWLGTAFDELYEGTSPWVERKNNFFSWYSDDVDHDEEIKPKNNNVYKQLVKKGIDVFNINKAERENMPNDIKIYKRLITHTHDMNAKIYQNLIILKDRCIFQVFINEPISYLGLGTAPESYYEIELTYSDPLKGKVPEFIRAKIEATPRLGQ